MSENKHDEDDDEVEDYMSDALLNQITDTRPGLVFSRPTARRYELERRHAALNAATRQIPVRELEVQRREEALNTSTLTADNKGFGLMLKMGYKTGETLGKASMTPNEQNRSLEPIKVVLKSDRGGLGAEEEARKRKLDEIEQLRKRFKSKQRTEEDHKTLASDYLNRKKSSFQLRKLRHRLHKCQRVCFQLDSERKQRKRPDVAWYWPNVVLRAIKSDKSVIKDQNALAKKNVVVKAIEEDEDEEENHAVDERYGFCEKADQRSQAKIDLAGVYNERLDAFLRSGGVETEEASLSSKKRSFSEHSQDVVEDDGEEEEEMPNQRVRENKVLAEIKKSEDDGFSDKEADELEDHEEEEENDEELITKKTDAISLYLRHEYIYCVWCTASFTSHDEMELTCPGLTPAEHDLDE